MKLMYVIAAIVAIGVAAWIFTGASGREVLAKLGGGETVAAAETAPAAPRATTPAPAVGAAATPAQGMQSVRVQSLTAVNRVREVTVRGHTEASRTVTVRAEIPGVITELRVSKGDRVVANQVIARLDLADRASRLTEAQANVANRQLEYNIAKALTDQGNTALTRLVSAQAALESANAALAKVQLEIEKTEIRAPFPGVVEDRQAQMGDFLNAAAAVAVVVDDDPFLVVGAISENDVGLVKVGTKANATLIDGRAVTGTIRFLATVADPQTRTYRVEMSVVNPQKNIRTGMTSTMVIPVGTAEAHLVSPAALVLDDKGQVGVKVVNAAGVVEFLPARVLAADNAGVWLDGLPRQMVVITVGQQFARAGEPVRVVEDRQGAGL
ncbi:MAG: efflux RND transporter periplasmic adaptor subunit [Alphaproteobacteria bacterium]|nr:efflux RND transporter periplasmic adaptor subunit [Alphaproteobacteria bacterium]